MTKISRRVFLGVSSAAATVAASQLISSCTKKIPSINLYSARHYNTDNELYKDFTQQTGIQVNLVEGEADQLIERIKSEGNNSPADIFIAVDIARLWRAEQAGIFAPVTSAVLTERIPANLRHPQGYWFGFTTRARAILYSKERVDPSELSTYEDLANPKWKGRIVVRSSANTYNQSLVASLIVANGEAETEKWCRGLVANLAQPPQGNDVNRIEAVAAGTADLTLANTYYFARFANSKDLIEQEIFKKVGVFFPNQQGRGTHVNISGGGVVKTAPNREGAIKFLEYLSTDKAQTYFARGNNEYPAVPSVAPDSAIAALGKFKPDLTDIASYGPNLAKGVEIMTRSGWK